MKNYSLLRLSSTIAISTASTAIISVGIAGVSHAASLTETTGVGQPHENMQPFQTLTPIIALEGIFTSEGSGCNGCLGQLKMFAGNFAPGGWAKAEGQLLPIDQNQALFAILGNTYGGNGRTTFGLPDLRGRTIIGAGQGAGLSNYQLGQKTGVEEVILTVEQIPSHEHKLTSSSLTGGAGGNQPHENIQPSLALNPIIALQGAFPSRDSNSCSDIACIGEIKMFAGNFAPEGWAFADGRLLPIDQNPALFAILGNTYGGDGRTTVGLPNLRGRTIIGEGLGPGLSNYRIGQRGGTEEVVLNVMNLPSHAHTIPDSQKVPEPMSLFSLFAFGVIGLSSAFKDNQKKINRGEKRDFLS